MQKDFEGIVKVYYQGQTMTGYLQLTKDIQTIHVKVEEQELLETFKNNLNETFVFHCKKMKSGGWISLFECQLQKFHASDENEAEVIFRPGIYIDNSFELQATDLQDIKLFGLTASYTQLHLLFQGLNTQEEIKGRFHHHNNEIIFKIKLGSWERGTLFEEIKQPRVLVTFRTKKSVGFHYLEDLFFRFTTMVSFLANHFTPVEHFSYKNKHAYTKGMSKIFYSSREENMFLQKPKITQYLHRLQPNSNEIKQAIIDPMISKNFKLWMHFVSTFRFKHQSLEDKFLSYYRCLESLGTHHNGGNQKYASEELNHLIENLDTALLQSDFVFSLEDIDHIKKVQEEEMQNQLEMLFNN